MISQSTSQSKNNRQPTDDQWMCAQFVNQSTIYSPPAQARPSVWPGWWGQRGETVWVLRYSDGSVEGRTVKEVGRTVGDMGTSGIRRTHAPYTTLLPRKMRAIFLMLFTDSEFQFLCNNIKCTNNGISNVKISPRSLLSNL